MKKLNNGKAAGDDGIVGEMLKSGEDVVCKWLSRIFNICWERGEVPRDWRAAVVLPVYKGKGDMKECCKYRGISILNVVGKVYGRILIERENVITEDRVGEEKSGFKKGRLKGNVEMRVCGWRV